MDKFRLLYEIKSKGLNVEKLCKIIKMPKVSFYRKLNQKTDFTVPEVQRIMDALQLETPMGVFFTISVSGNDTNGDD